jgi:hypothetical protein
MLIRNLFKFYVFFSKLSLHLKVESLSLYKYMQERKEQKGLKTISSSLTLCVLNSLFLRI